MDVPTFQNTFPAFRQTDPQFIQATLNRASRWIDTCVWGSMADDGIALLAAHWLHIDPLGASTAGAEAKSPYWEQFALMRKAVTAGPWGGW